MAPGILNFPKLKIGTDICSKKRKKRKKQPALLQFAHAANEQFVSGDSQHIFHDYYEECIKIMDHICLRYV